MGKCVSHSGPLLPPPPNISSISPTWIPCQPVVPSHFISWKTHFVVLAGSGSYQIWWGPLPANTTKWVFREIKRDGITSLHGIHVSLMTIWYACLWKDIKKFCDVASLVVLLAGPPIPLRCWSWVLLSTWKKF